MKGMRRISRSLPFPKADGSVSLRRQMHLSNRASASVSLTAMRCSSQRLFRPAIVMRMRPSVPLSTLKHSGARFAFTRTILIQSGMSLLSLLAMADLIWVRTIASCGRLVSEWVDDRSVIQGSATGRRNRNGTDKTDRTDDDGDTG